MSRKKKKKALSFKEKAELVIELVTAIASLITAIGTFLKD